MAKVNSLSFLPFQLKIIPLLLAGIFISQTSFGQNYELKSVFYNTLLGGISAGIGAMINKKPGEKRLKTFAKGFAIGCGGGAVMYAGKKSNIIISGQKNITWAWLTRGIFSAGNSIVENAAANRIWWGQWHYDIGFIRFEVNTKNKFGIQPKLMPSYFGAFVFTASQGRFDTKATLQSGTLVFRTAQIHYAPYLVGSTTGNSILFVDTLGRNPFFYEIFAHEMVHTSQFQELSGTNYYLNPVTAKWKANSPRFKQFSKWVYGDLNYELMLGNYFLVQGGLKRSLYCRNFLENEAEVLTTGRISCPPGCVCP